MIDQTTLFGGQTRRAGRPMRDGITRRIGGVVAVALAAAGLSVVVTATPAQALDNGLAKTPPMGFNDWNSFGCNVDEQLIKQTADLFVSSGLKAAGYQYVNIDDCWLQSSRDASGNLQPDYTKFPDGISGTAEQYKALLKDYQLASSGGALSDEERMKFVGRVFKLRNEFALRFLELAEHLVERFRQDPDFLAAFHRRPDREVRYSEVVGAEAEEHLIPEAEDSHPDPETRCIAADLTEKAFRGCAPVMANIFVLNKAEGWTNRELAKFYGTSAQTVKSRVFRTRIRLRQQIAALTPARESAC